MVSNIGQFRHISDIVSGVEIPNTILTLEYRRGQPIF